MTEIPEEVLQRVSPQSLELKSFLKVPMLLLLVTAGLLSGMSVCFLKLIGEMIQNGEVGGHIGIFILLAVVALLSVPAMVHSLNLAMKYFDQLQVMPIFQVCLMIMWICSGMMILQESKNYTWG